MTRREREILRALAACRRLHEERPWGTDRSRFLNLRRLGTHQAMMERLYMRGLVDGPRWTSDSSWWCITAEGILALEEANAAKA